MSIPIACTSCNYEFHVGDQLAGRRGKCPKCGHVLTVPQSAAEAAGPASIPAPPRPATVPRDARVPPKAPRQRAAPPPPPPVGIPPSAQGPAGVPNVAPANARSSVSARLKRRKSAWPAVVVAVVAATVLGGVAWAAVMGVGPFGDGPEVAQNESDSGDNKSAPPSKEAKAPDVGDDVDSGERAESMPAPPGATGPADARATDPAASAQDLVARRAETLDSSQGSTDGAAVAATAAARAPRDPELRANSLATKRALPAERIPPDELSAAVVTAAGQQCEAIDWRPRRETDYAILADLARVVTWAQRPDSLPDGVEPPDSDAQLPLAEAVEETFRALNEVDWSADRCRAINDEAVARLQSPGKPILLVGGVGRRVRSQLLVVVPDTHHAILIDADAQQLKLPTGRPVVVLGIVSDRKDFYPSGGDVLEMREAAVVTRGHLLVLAAATEGDAPPAEEGPSGDE